MSNSKPMSTSKPVHEIRLGVVKATIWPGRLEGATRYNATVCRLYRDGDVWKTSESFGRDELPLVIKALDMAHTWMLTTGANASIPRGDTNGTSISGVDGGGVR